MSFSSDVKKELLAIYPEARHCQIAEIAGISAVIAREGSGMNCLVIESENDGLLEKYFTLLGKTINISTVGKNDVISLPDTRKLLELLKKDTADLSVVDPVLVQQDCCRRSFLRGFFIAAGSVSNPERSYHLEMVCRSMEQAVQVSRMMAGFDTQPHIIDRKGHKIVYLKEDDQIETIIGVIGASEAFMQFENIRIMKGMRETINRQVNCETSNIRKSVNAAVRQADDIRLIQDTGNFSLLSDSLQEAARLRLQYPDMPLAELGGKCVPPVGKSGINHRLRKIGQIADSIRSKA